LQTLTLPSWSERTLAKENEQQKEMKARDKTIKHTSKYWKIHTAKPGPRQTTEKTHSRTLHMAKVLGHVYVLDVFDGTVMTVAFAECLLTIERL
jgi:hypothetical protein